MRTSFPNCSGCTHVLRSAESDACDALDVLQSELGDGLASLLLVAGVDSDRGTRGDVGLTLLALRLVAGLLLLNLDVLLLRLIGELLNAWVGHDFVCSELVELVVVVLHFAEVRVGASQY
jgi:hypothetical protein